MALVVVPQILFHPKSYLFCELKPHAKFQKPMIIPSGRKVTQGERRKKKRRKNAINSGHFVPCSAQSFWKYNFPGQTIRFFVTNKTQATEGDISHRGQGAFAGDDHGEDTAIKHKLHAVVFSIRVQVSVNNFLQNRFV